MKYVIIYSHPGAGFAQPIVPATGPDDDPPNSVRTEIDADDQAGAEAIADERYGDRSGTVRVFPLAALAPPAASLASPLAAASEPAPVEGAV